MNRLQQALDAGRFVCVLEASPRFSPTQRAALEQILQHGQLAGWPLLPAFSDRVGLQPGPGPLEAAGTLNNPTPALLHFSGKDREQSDLLQQIRAMRALGLKQLLLLSGDRLPGHQPDQTPVRYLESVPALQITRRHCPDWLLGAALNPFKYCEEESQAQYLKGQKKLLAGADFLTLQLGFDADKHLEAHAWMRRQPASKPVLACVMRLTVKRAAVLQSVPGILITDSMRSFLQHEQKLSETAASERSLERLALQIIGLQLMGYAGIHLSGVHSLEELLALEQAIIRLRDSLTSLEQWQLRWQASWQLPGTAAVCFTPPATARWTPGQPGVTASRKELLRYRFFYAVHEQLFDRNGWPGRAFGWCMAQPVWKKPWPARTLHAVERAIKRPLLGCDTCGTCRLQDTLYVCPETCPKGLANGPCGGTRQNRCEFGDRECIHSIKYRIAKSADQLPVLAHNLIPCIQADERHRSSWPGWFEADQPGQNDP
ncbi:methylenetetrahydrofolate reductase C-terminal domain-containing protein [Thiopseudomonas denitrificans]|uniref:Methylenetetrahydrofolate reductase n=1 Tax=Thiopseudomonas denitrificans TaxID=1501432 RepID=A0A4R6U028_9GAMM|nr:methylenetetrahydrofolate reductase C-terminal domain-containing protein [Thiopseudomonas denitrificans]TDQ39600.1 methylenetetrahydrofolate reductase (NADPH) [Thiopseudomonas denitrificans]